MFRNQYILTDKIIDAPKDSKCLKIDNYNLIISKEINIFSSKNDKIILIGYTFHCYNANSEKKIVEQLSKLEKKEDLLTEIDNLCGHFVLFIKNTNFEIYTDASSSFKVYYGTSDNYTFIASDPKTICKFHNFEFDQEKEKKKFYESDYFLTENTKIGHHTRYKGIYQLVSNHCLSVDHLKSERIFPRNIRREISIEEASEKIIPILENILVQINKHYTIFTSITAGYDSRLLMSATRNFSKNIQYYTFKLPKVPKDIVDYTLPPKICHDLKLNYSSIQICNLDKQIIDEVKTIYDLPKIRPFQQYRDIFSKNKKPNILLVGFVSEVAKNYLERVKVKNGKDAVRAIHCPDNQYLNNYYQNWLNSNQLKIKNLGYEVLDFIHWEQDITNFAGQNTYYAHHYVNLFSIFNSREILKIMLSVAIKKRDGKSPVLFKHLIKKMWPDLIKYPFNHTRKERIILIMKKIKVYPLYKYLQLKLKNNGKV